MDTTRRTPTAAPDRPGARPPSPWSGSHHEELLRWQLEQVRSLDEAARTLRTVAAGLADAHRAGWWLEEPVTRGRVVAARASRRTRAATPPQPAATGTAPRLPPWRLRVVDEPPLDGDVVLHLGPDAPARTPVVARAAGTWAQVGGPALAPDEREALLDRLADLDDGGRTWAVARARVGPVLDVVADGSALRVHAVRDGRLVRTVEALSFLHAADRATTLADAAAAFLRLAGAVEASARAGGRLDGTDDGLLHVGYPGA